MTLSNMLRISIRGNDVARYAAFSKRVGLYFLASAISSHDKDIVEAGLTPASRSL